MPTLNIGGKRIKVGDEFLQMTPEQQNASVEEIAQQLQGDNSTKSDRFFSNMNASASGFAEGIPIVGPAFNQGLNMAEAGLRSLSGPESYDEEYKKVTGQEAADRASNPGTTTAGNVAGGIYGTAPLAVAAPAAFGVSKAPLVSRALMAGATSAGIGGTDSAVRSGGDPMEIIKGTGTGFAGGALSPLITSGLGAGAKYLFPGAQDELSRMPGRAQRFLERTMGDPAKLARDKAALDALGPEAVPADVSPLMRQLGRGAASRPEMTDEIVQAMEARKAGAGGRLKTDLDASLGPAVVPSEVETGLKASRSALGPEYDAVAAKADQAVDVLPLIAGLKSTVAGSAGGPQKAASSVLAMFTNAGNADGVSGSMMRPSKLLAIRRAIDDMMEVEAIGNTEKGILGAARQQVDEALKKAAPGIKAVDAKFEELSKQSAALERGQQLFGNGPEAVRPQELAAEMTAAKQPTGEMVGPSAQNIRTQQGMRARLDLATGTQANDPVALKGVMKGDGDWNRLKLEEAFGPERAGKALGSVDREVKFDNTANRMTGGSDTAAGKQVNQLFDDIENPAKTPGDLSIPGLIAKGGRKVIDALFQGNAEATGRKFAEDLGRLTIAKGAQRDALYKALQERAARVPDPKNRAVLNALISSSAQSGAQSAF